MLVRVTQQDVVYRRYLIRESPLAIIPDFGVYIKVQGPKGDVEYRSLSRQLVMFCVERRKAWRMLQSKAGIENKEYKAQRSILADVDAGKISREDFFARAEELLKAKLSIAEAAAHPAAHAATPVPAAAAKKPVPSPAPMKKNPAPEPPKVVAAVAATVTVTTVTENESQEWEQRVQLRMMELDVDPGHDAEREAGKSGGD